MNEPDEIRDSSVGENFEGLSFWEHLDVLRDCLIRIAVAAVLAGIVAFCLKEQLFDLILAPSRAEFFLYRWLGVTDGEDIRLMNTGLAEQMMIHIKVSAVAGVVAVSPYIIYVLFGFISPALYDNERKYGVGVTLAAYMMFVVGLVVNYVLIFPLTVRFLGTYQVSDDVANMITISSYIDTLLMMSLVFGIVFELPVLSWLLGRLGLLRAAWMRRYRRHAIVAILIVAAVITPTADMFTLLIVSLPIWILYEVSILIVRN